MAQLRSQYQFVTDRQVLDPLNRLAAPLFAVPSNASDRFTLFVTTSKEINAFALPGGTIVFHRGLLERARTVEEIQGVLAHEMAHVRKRHGVLQLAQSAGMSLALQQLQGGENRMLDTLIRDSGQLLSLKFSRDHERAADDLGWLIVPADDGVLLEKQESQGFPLVSDVQIYLDLLHVGQRGPEQAVELRGWEGFAR